MKKRILNFIALTSIVIAATSCNAIKNCGNKKNGSAARSCSNSCSSISKSKQMENKNETCEKCGKISCDKSCSSGTSSSMNGISESLCTTKTTEQIKAEAEAFRKMDAFKKISSVKELETGYEFVYENVDDKLTLELMDFLKLELKCCPMYDYALVTDARKKTIRYQRYGSPEIKSELKAYLQMINLVK